MPQIAYLLSPQGATTNQQKDKPNVENTAVASYANQLKNNTFSYNPIKTQSVGRNPNILSNLLGAFGLGENKARAKLNDILNVLQKIDEKKERDYQIWHMQQEIQKEKDDIRHKEMVNLFVQATKRRRKYKSSTRKKPMAGGIPSTLLIAGGALALLTLSSNAFAGIKKNIDIDLIEGVKKDFQEDLKELENSFSENIFKDEYEKMKESFKEEFGELDKIRQFFEEKFSGLDLPEMNAEKEFNQDADKLFGDLEKQAETMEKMLMSIDENQTAAETQRLQRQGNPPPTTVTPVKGGNVTKTATPISTPTRKETVQRAASLSIAGESGTTTRETAIGKLGQIVENDPSPGQKSYGIFGLNTTGGINTFVDQYGKQFGLEGIKPGSPEFDKKWTEIARTRSSEFFNAQLQWYENNIVTPIESKLLSFLPADVAKDPKVLIYMADRRLQYGYTMEDDALINAVDSKTPEEFIRKMSIFDKQNVERAFRTYLGNNPKNRQGLINRINDRELKSLNSENLNFLGNLIDQGSREIDLAYMEENYRGGGSLIAINNMNIVSQKLIKQNLDIDTHVHPLVG